MISSRHNESIKTIRRLRGRQGDHALLEGPHLLAEALACGARARDGAGDARGAAASRGRPSRLPARPSPLEVAAAVLDGLADSDSPRGLLALARLPRAGCSSRCPAGGDTVVLYLDGVQDPGNVGALARVAEAFGAEALALAPGCAHPNHPRALRASAGSLLRLPVAVEATVAGVDGRLGRNGARWAALAAHGGRRARHARMACRGLGARGRRRGRRAVGRGRRARSTSAGRFRSPAASSRSTSRWPAGSRSTRSPWRSGGPRRPDGARPQPARSFSAWMSAGTISWRSPTMP